MSSAAPPAARSRLVDYTTPKRTDQHAAAAALAPKLNSGALKTSAMNTGQRFTAAVVVAFIFGTTALSLYDLYLFLTLVAR